MRRGEVWWADLPLPDRRRPVVLLSCDLAYDIRGFVTIAPVTTHISRISAEVCLGPIDGLPREGVVNLDNINTIDKGMLQQFIVGLTEEKICAVEEALRFALGMEE